MASASFFKNALLHPLNMLLLGVAGASAVVTGSVLPLAIGAGAELLWLALGRSMPGQKEYLAFLNKDVAKQLGAVNEQTLLNKVKESDRRRFLEIDRLRNDIRNLSHDNPSLTTDMLGSELEKIDQLVQLFLKVASNVARYEDYVESSDLNDLEDEVRRQEKLVEKTQDPEAREVAAQNLELMQSRLERSANIRKQIRGARGQLDLVENTIRLLRDQIVTMESPEELRDKLDDVVRNVDVIEATAKETESLERRLQAGLQGSTH